MSVEPDWVPEARRLREAGFGYVRIGERVGQTHNAVYYWLTVRTRQNARAMKTCPTCGEEFKVYDLTRKFCSRDCFYQSPHGEESRRKRREAMRKRDRHGERNPNYKHGQRVGIQVREREQRFKSGQNECQHPNCDRDTDLLNQHHVVYDQHVRDKGGDRWDPRNALALCTVCHSSHHRRGTYIVPLLALRDENYEFAWELLGPAAYDYLRRRYSGEDPRLDALLSEDVAA